MIYAAANWDAIEAIGTTAGSFFTAAAFLLTYVALRRERRTRREEIARLDREFLANEAAQASLVVIGDNESQLGSGEAALTLSNFSQRPVFDVHVRPLLNGKVVEAGDGRSTRAVIESILQPGEHQKITMTVVHGQEPLVAGRLEFRDSMGLRWRRDNNGPPQRLTDE